MSAVRASGLTLAYGSTLAVTEATFSVPGAGVTVVIGPNGSGKSTLLSAIAGLKRPVAGTLEVLDRSPERAQRRVAFVLQATKVNEAMPVTVREVVQMGRYASMGWLGRAGAVDRTLVDSAVSRLDLAELAGRQLSELSGGERQRVFIAQSLVQEHDLLLLDEPHSGLDVVSAAVIDDVVAQEREAGRPVILSTHDLAAATAADYVILMDRRVVAAGGPTEVLTAEHLSAAYGTAVVQLDDGSVVVDDPAHRPVPGRHVHLEREVHPEGPGADLHPR